MRILFFIEHLGLGGVVRQLSILTDELDRRGHQTSFLALYPIDQDWSFIWKRDFRVLTHKPTGILSAAMEFTKAAFAVRRLLKKNDIDILYGFQGPNARLIAWLATRGMAKTQLVWGFRADGANTSVGKNWKRALPFHLGKWMSGSVPLTIANSEAGLTRWNTSGYRFGKHLVITNGVDTDEFKPDAEARMRLRSQWKIKNEALIGIVGRLFVSKGHSVFLEAAELLWRERSDVRFVIVGDGPEKRELELLSEELGLRESLIWAGARQDMPAVYNALDVLCSSSCSEGFSNVIGEAMACGVPCVVTDVGDSAGIVADQGIVVPAYDSRALAKGLKTMLSKLGDIKPVEIRGRILRCFSLVTLVDSTEAALNELHLVGKGHQRSKSLRKSG